MQRSISHQNSLTTLLYVVLFILYSSLSSIYLLLPPLFGVLFVLFSKSLESRDTISILLIAFCLVIFETNMGYPLFSSIIYFTLVYKLVIPKIEQNFNCNSCMKLSNVLLPYVGYYLFLLLISKIFLLPLPSFNYYIIYYIIIEFFLVSIL